MGRSISDSAPMVGKAQRIAALAAIGQASLEARR